MQKITLNNITIEVTDEQVEEIVEKYKNKDKRWKPEVNKGYFYVDDFRYISNAIFVNDKHDRYHLGQGNMFKTQAEAEKHVEKLEAISDVVNYCYENDFVVDYVLNEDKKFFIQYSIEGNEDKCFVTNFCYGWIDVAVLPYLKSEEAALQVIKEKEKELKLIFDVK
jgi:hypothetical protein